MTTMTMDGAIQVKCMQCGFGSGFASIDPDYVFCDDIAIEGGR